MTVEHTYTTSDDVDALARERDALLVALAQSSDADDLTSERLAQVDGLLLSLPCRSASQAALALSLVAQGFSSGWRTDRAEARALASVAAYLERPGLRERADAELIALGARHQECVGTVADSSERCARGAAPEAQADAACAKLFAIEDQILATRATSPAGWQVKARVVAQVIGDEPDGTYEDAVTRNLLADMLRGEA